MFAAFLLGLLFCSGCAHKPKTLHKTTTQKFHSSIRRMTLETVFLQRKGELLYWNSLTEKQMFTVNNAPAVASLCGYAVFLFEANGFIPNKPTYTLKPAHSSFTIPQKYIHYWAVIRPIYNTVNQKIFGPTSNIAAK